MALHDAQGGIELPEDLRLRLLALLSQDAGQPVTMTYQPVGSDGTYASSSLPGFTLRVD